ncbi:unnamed protein product [Paramecium sonneborni]|uniref:non-specific serine/threonine protein kinase n=1 Tax=Paramecium sonneborni TaxID=65129 RepID=A0A8S1NWB8_9CILI|nr:unnamed protein product [Paramecium sonneborni]
MNQQFSQQNFIYLPSYQITIIIQFKKGSGSQGTVYQGFIKNTNQKVALKVVKELNSKEEIILRNIQQKKPKNIIGVYAIEKLNNIYYIVMELAEMDLFQYINTNEFINQDIHEKNQLFYQMVLGLEEFHNMGYFHRDLKPENYVCCRDQEQKLIIKLIDFGLSKNQSDSDRQTLNIGTPYYIAREVLENENYTKAIDVWAMGIIWYEILTRKLFFDGMNQFMIINQINQIKQNEIYQKIDVIDNVQNNVKEILKQMICLDSERRIKLDDVRNKLKEIINQRDRQNIEELKQNLQKEFQEKERNLMQINQIKLNELSQNMKQKQEEEIEQIKQQLQSHYNQLILNKENELRKVIGQQELTINQNKEQQKLQQELQFQAQINKYKAQCQIEFDQKIQEEAQRLKNQIRESLLRKKQLEDEQIKKKIQQETELKYQKELKAKEQELQLQAQKQYENELNLKKQSLKNTINILKDAINNSIGVIEKQKQEILSYQQSQCDLQNLLQLIINFINEKKEELKKISKEENNLENLEIFKQYSWILNLENQYKNQFQILNQETNIINQDIQKFIIKFQKEQQIKQMEDKQNQEQQIYQQAIKDYYLKYQSLKNEFDQLQNSVENIKIKCQNYSYFNQRVNDKFQQLKQNSNIIALQLNQLIQFYQGEENCISGVLLNFIYIQQQDIQHLLELFRERIQELNDLLIVQEQELKQEKCYYMNQMDDQIYEINYKIKNSMKFQDENQNDIIYNQLEEKKNKIQQLKQQLTSLSQNELSISNYIQIKNCFQQEIDSVKILTKQLLENQQKDTQLKIITQKQIDFLMDVQSKSSQFQGSMKELIVQLNSLKNQCSLFKNEQINNLLDQKEKELNDLMQQAKEKFDEFSQKTNHTQESQKIINQIKEECNQFQVEIEKKKQEQNQQIIELDRLYQQTLSKNESQTEKDYQQIQEALKNLKQKLNSSSQEFLGLDIKNYNYDYIVNNQQQSQNQFNELLEMIKSYLTMSEQNQNVSQELKKKLQTITFQFQNKDSISKLAELQQRTQVKSKELIKMIEVIEKYKNQIKFSNLEEEQRKQKSWMEIQKSIEELNFNLIEFKGQIDGMRQSNYQENYLKKKYKDFEENVNNLCQKIPQKAELKHLEITFQQNHQSFTILYLLIIIIKAYNLKRYSMRLKEQKEQSKNIYLQQNQLQQFHVNNDRNQLLKKALNYIMEANCIIEKYELCLQKKRFIYNYEEQTKDDQMLDNNIKDIQNFIKIQHSVKIRGFLKDYKQINDQSQESLEFCDISVLFKQFYQLTGKKQI